MPYISDSVPAGGLASDPVRAAAFVRSVRVCWPESVSELVLEAVNAGKRVEIRSSSFKDPGADWNEILVDGVVLPGSRLEGY